LLKKHLRINYSTLCQRARSQGKASEQGLRARLQGKASGQGLRARLQGKASGQGLRARLQGKASKRVSEKKNSYFNYDKPQRGLPLLKFSQGKIIYIYIYIIDEIPYSDVNNQLNY
jgi:hypothetical protein